MVVQQEYALRDNEFHQIADLVRDTTGIVIDDRKRSFVLGRLGRRLRTLGLADFEQYCRLLVGPAGEAERGMLVNAITTNHTSFFREPHHFDYLTETALPEIVAEPSLRSRRLRIWSAGCSTGEEPYTLAMVMHGFQPLLDRWDTRILATDLDTNVLAKAKAGLYDAERADAIPDDFRRRYVSHQPDGQVSISAHLRELITFKQLNLLQDWPMSGPFDIIFCRNVVIYFDKPTQRQLFDRYAELLRPDGWLIVGHSESLMNVTTRFELVGRTIYRRTQ